MIKKSDVESHIAFIRIPKPLIHDSKYNQLSVTAKFMYGLLYDRLQLSLKNKWYDAEGNVFQYYTNEQLMIDLSTSEKTIIKVKKELSSIGLLKEVRQGVNLPNRLYLSAVTGTVKSTVQELENLQLGAEESTVQELENLQGSKTEKNKTDINNNILSTCKEILDYLNELTNSNFRATNKSTQKLINARLNEGYTVDDIKLVIKDKTAEWGHDRDMEKYLRPSTLFKVSKFEEYLEKALKNKSKTDKLDKPDERLGF